MRSSDSARSPIEECRKPFLFPAARVPIQQAGNRRKTARTPLLVSRPLWGSSMYHAPRRRHSPFTFVGRAGSNTNTSADPDVSRIPAITVMCASSMLDPELDKLVGHDVIPLTGSYRS